MKSTATTAKRVPAAALRLAAPAEAGARGPTIPPLTVVAVPREDRTRAMAAAKRIRELSERRKPSRAHGATKAIRELRDDGQ